MTGAVRRNGPGMMRFETGIGIDTDRRIGGMRRIDVIEMGVIVAEGSL